MRLAVAAAAVLSIACGRTPSPDISLIGSPDPTAIEVRGLPARDLETLSLAKWSPDLWHAVLRVEVSGAGQPMAGEYAVRDGRLRFTPMYGFDKGRTFVARFDARKIPAIDVGEPWRQQPFERTFTVAGATATRSTVVRQVYPSGPTLPENMLRFYIEFSAPMGRGSALEHIRLEDDSGKVVIDPFLPVEAEFWNPERTRFTLFFDPGRVKRGIKPNRDLGRALVAGKKYALVIDERWIDGQGQPLKQAHRHEFMAGPAIEHGLDLGTWTISDPNAGTREPLMITFPYALDYGLLQRALALHVGTFEPKGAAIAGEATIDANETRWSFTPRDPWISDNYMLVALTLLEDPAGNRIGRAFEVMRPVNERERVERMFTIKRTGR
jgi:hypothetical protein